MSDAACWCCGEPAPIRGEDDPWEGRLDGYCVSCATTRCDTTDSTCAVKSAALRRLRAVPAEVTFVDEDAKDLGWGAWELTLGERSLIAESMTRWHQSFETTVQRMIRSGLRSLQRKTVTP